MGLRAQRWIPGLTFRHFPCNDTATILASHPSSIDLTGQTASIGRNGIRAGWIFDGSCFDRSDGSEDILRLRLLLLLKNGGGGGLIVIAGCCVVRELTGIIWKINWISWCLGRKFVLLYLLLERSTSLSASKAIIFIRFVRNGIKWGRRIIKDASAII